MPLKALIIGGGIGGLATAIALDRRGIEVAIFEQGAAPDLGGASLSIEDAFVLAACLGDGEADPVAAIGRYEAIRLAHAAELQGSSQSAAESFYLPDGEEQRARDAAYASLHETKPWGPREGLWDYDVRAELTA